MDMFEQYEDELTDVTDLFLNAVVIYIHIMKLFVKYRKLAEEISESERETRQLARPGSYCLHGTHSRIYRAVVARNETVIKKHLRLSHKSFHEVINYSQSFLNCHRGWGPHFCVSVFLYWLGCGASYRVTGASFNVSRYTVRDIVHKCLDGFLSLLPSVIKYPAEDTYENTGRKFNRRAGTNIFSYALGAIDGTHVRVRVPSRLRHQYINRKCVTSIQLQAVCSGNGQLISICVGYPGSVHDERVLQNSILFKEHKFPPDGYYLLGDSGYKCRVSPITIITPFRRTRELTAREEKFNMLHSKARSIIETTFGIMKTRWRAIFDRDLQLSLENSIKTITVACIMHNICTQDGVEEVFNLETEVISDLSEIQRDDDDSYAVEFRKTLSEAIHM